MSNISSGQLTTLWGVAVVIPFHRGNEFLIPCIDSIRANTLLPGSIYVVDNDPDGIPFTSSLRNDKTIHIVKTKPAIGFGRASNAGVDAAFRDGYQLFVILNQDTILDRHCLESLVNAHTHASRICVISATAKLYDGDEISPHFREYILDQIPFYHEHESGGIQKPVYPMPVIVATCILVDSHVYTQIGLFDPVFSMYGEDDDLSNRITIARGELLLCPAAYVHHRHSFEHATGEQRRNIENHRLNSIMILNIRYKHWSKFMLMMRCFWQLYRYLTQPSLRQTSHPWLYFKYALLNLRRWSQLKAYEPDQVKSRIQQYLQKDLLV